MWRQFVPSPAPCVTPSLRHTIAFDRFQGRYVPPMDAAVLSSLAPSSGGALVLPTHVRRAMSVVGSFDAASVAEDGDGTAAGSAARALNALAASTPSMHLLAFPDASVRRLVRCSSVVPGTLLAPLGVYGLPYSRFHGDCSCYGRAGPIGDCVPSQWRPIVPPSGSAPVSPLEPAASVPPSTRRACCNHGVPVGKCRLCSTRNHRWW